MIRILHSVSNMDRGGIETMLMNYYRNIDREQIQFDFLCNKAKPGAYDEEIKKLGGRIFHSPGLNPLKYPQYIKYIKNLIKEHPEYKIIHAHNGALGVYALNSAKRAKVPVRIFHAHGTKIAKDLKLPIKLVCKTRIKADSSDLWTCGTEAARYYFGNEVVEKKEYQLITNAIEIEKFTFNEQKRAKLRREFNIENNFVVGHVGRFTEEKNHKFVIDVFDKLKAYAKDAKLVLVGDGKLFFEMQKYAESLGISEDVIFTGSVNNVDEWYQAFDLFVLPSTREGLPVVGIEAQASGLKCLFSKNVTDEVAVTSNAKFLSIDNGPEIWTQEIIKYNKGYERDNAEEEIRSAGYDIKVEAKKLQERYTNLSEGI